MKAPNWAGVPGTDTYARMSLVIPMLLLAAGARRAGGRNVRADLRRFRAVSAVTVGCLLLLALPLAILSGRPTTVSLGSCDAADYAAGARRPSSLARAVRSHPRAPAAPPPCRSSPPT